MGSPRRICSAGDRLRQISTYCKRYIVFTFSYYATTFLLGIGQVCLIAEDSQDLRHRPHHVDGNRTRQTMYMAFTESICIQDDGGNLALGPVQFLALLRAAFHRSVAGATHEDYRSLKDSPQPRHILSSSISALRFLLGADDLVEKLELSLS